MRGVDLTVLEFAAKVMGAKTVNSIVAASKAVSAITERVTFFYVVTRLATPIAYFVVVLAPSIYGMVANGDLSLASSLAFEIGGLVHVAVDAATDVGDGIGGSKSF